MFALRFLLPILAAAWALVPAPADAATNDPVLVRARSFAIRRSEIDAGVRQFTETLKTRGITVTGAQRAEAFRRILDQQIFVRLCQSRATDADRDTARARSAEFIADRRRELGAEALSRMIGEAGHTEESFAEAKFAESLVTAVIDREVGADIHIPSSDVRAHYESDPEPWRTPETLHIERLTVRPDPAAPIDDPAPLRTVADRLRQELADGAPTAAVASGERTEGLRAAADTLRVPVAALEPGPAEALEGLMPGGVTQPMPAGNGWMILRLVERFPARLRPLSEVEQDIRTLLRRREIEARIPEYFQRIQTEESLVRTGTDTGS